ncbi:MAG: N-acylneuraminate cytidylyltransferase [Aureliella sp.]
MTDSPITIAAIITARGGSKRLPGKNLELLHGRSLLSHSIDAALQCKHIDLTCVTTDCDDIAQEATRCCAHVIRRPSELSDDDTSSYDTVIHALDKLEEQGRNFDYFALLQPTSPLRTARHTTEAIELLLAYPESVSVVSVCTMEHSPYKAFLREGAFLTPLFAQETLNVPTQRLPIVFRQNGAIYLMPVDRFRQGNSFFCEPVLPYQMTQESSMDVDTHLDLQIIRAISLSNGRGDK